MLLLLKVVVWVMAVIAMAVLVPSIFFLACFVYWMWDEMAGMVKRWLSR